MHLKTVFVNFSREKYTLLLIPRKKGTTRSYNLNKLILISILTVVILFIISMTSFMLLYITERENTTKLKKHNDAHISSIKTLQDINDFQSEQIQKFYEESEKLKSKGFKLFLLPYRIQPHPLQSPILWGIIGGQKLDVNNRPPICTDIAQNADGCSS